MNKRRKNFKIKLKLTLIFLLISALILALELKIRPVVLAVAKSQAKQMAIIALNDAITEELTKSGDDYSSLADIDYAPDGSVKSLQTNIKKLNLLKARITDNTARKISSYTDDDINLHLGSLLDIDFLSGRGPIINIKLQMASNALSDVESTFEDAGINQTRHKINIHFKFSVYIVIKGFNSSVDIDTAMTVAETIIVGAIPNNFTNIDGNNLPDEISNAYSFK
jgi:sporulation protein YunB